MLAPRESFPRVLMRHELPRGMAELCGTCGAFNSQWRRKPLRDQPALTPSPWHHGGRGWRRGPLASDTSQSEMLGFLHWKLHSDCDIKTQGGILVVLSRFPISACPLGQLS